MTYLVIATDGGLNEIPHVDWDAVIGPEGRARVRLPDYAATAGWVNDCGLLFPDRYPRNVVGACLLAAIGARPQPYAGPVVLTGWESRNTALGLPETRSLHPGQVADWRDLHADVRRALAGDVPARGSLAWAQQIREFADHVRIGPTPGITIRTVSLGGEG